jgi:valyl-tRNA synthetase
MLHPFTPFVTEYIYQEKYKNEESIMLEKISKQTSSKTSDFESQLIIEIFSQIKNLRIKNSIKNSKVIELNIVSDKKINQAYVNEVLSLHAIKINKITKVRDTDIKEVITSKNYSIEIVTTITNKLEEIRKNELLLVKLKAELDRSTAILSNQNFIKKASKEKVTAEENKQKEYMKQYEQIKSIIKELKK